MMKQKKLTNLNTYLIVALVIVVAIGLYFTLSVPTVKKEEAPPIVAREIQLTVLGSDCEDCFNISVATDFIKQQKGFNITELKEVSIEDAKEMTAKYNVSRLPALLVQGDLSNLTIPNFDAVEDALVFDLTPPPYYDVETQKIRGKVTLVQLSDATCTQCFNMSIVVDQLGQAGLKIVSSKVLDAKSEEGKGLIEKYKIEKIPTLVFNNDALEYDVVKEVWEQVGTEESDGMLVLRFVNPPYINTSSGKTEGLVGITYLFDEGCTECFNASVFKELFAQSFNMYFEKEESVEISSTKGKFLVKKYNITLVPTTVLSKEAGVYPSLAGAWDQVGSEEKDGAFVFRSVALLENYFKQTGGAFAYKDLSSGEVLSGATNSTEAEIEPPAEEDQ